MKTIFFNAYFEPEIAASLYLYSNIAEDLVAAGHEVIVVAPTPTRGVDGAARRIYATTKRFENLYDGKMKVIRLPLPREARHPIPRAARYVLMEAFFLLFALMVDYDVAFLYSTPPTQGPLAALMRLIRKKPVLYNIQDLFPESLASADLARPESTLWKLGEIMQRFTYRHVDKLLTISETLKTQISASGPAAENIEVVYNWVDESEVFPIPRSENSLVVKYGLDPAKIFVTYCGNIGHSQNLELLAQVASELEDFTEVEFVVIGDGAARAHLKEKTANLRNFRLLPFQPYDLISHVFSLGDLSLVISKQHVGANSVPSKAWSIMAASRPIILSFDADSELTRLVDSVGCGMSAGANDKDALLNAIVDLVKDPEQRERMGANGRRYVLENLTRRQSTTRIIRILEELAQSGPGRGSSAARISHG